MNDMVLVTLEEAKAIAKKLNAHGIGKGVRAVTSDNKTSGIYTMEYGGPFVPPENGDKKYYFFRFNNGADGICVALVKGIMAYSPVTWPTIIENDVSAMAHK
jgi:hypothetical protein